MGLRYRNLRGFEMGLAERREEAARPVETRVLPREVLEAQIRKVGWLRGRWSCKCGVVDVVEERCLMWRRRSCWWWWRRWRTTRENREYMIMMIVEMGMEEG